MKKDKVNDPNKPKRPPSCFFLFKEEFKKTYKEKHPYPSLKLLHNSPVCRVSIDAGEKWKRMLNAEKAPYIAKAKEMMAEYKQKMQAYNGGAPEIDEEEEEEEEEETLPLSPTTDQAACASSETTDHDDLGQLVADRFLKFRDAIIKDYLASKTFDKELDEHLDKYKGSEEHRKELAHHLERFKKSQDFHKVLAQHLETYKKSEEYKTELAEHLKRYKMSEDFQKTSSLVNEIKFLLLLLPFLLPLLLRPTDQEDDLDTLSLRELITKKIT